jgi:hypothetical protein
MLYLRGFDRRFPTRAEGLLGADAAGLAPTNISRLTAT